MSIGSNIRRLRRAKDLTQEQLAERVGVSRPWLSLAEKNIKTLSLPTAVAIAKVLECTLDEIVKDDAAASERGERL